MKSVTIKLQEIDCLNKIFTKHSIQNINLLKLKELIRVSEGEKVKKMYSNNWIITKKGRIN